MAGLEVVVRPVVFPDIRPRARQSLPPQDDPEKGIAVIQGNPAGSVGNSLSQSVSSSYSRPTETERRVDDVRVYQQDDDGTINKDNFVDLQVANRITMDEGGDERGGPFSIPGGGPGSGGGGEAGGTGAGFTDRRAYYYQRPKEEDNIEIRNKDTIIKNPVAPQ